MRVAQRSGQQDAYFYRLSTTGFLEWTVYSVIDPLTRIWADGAAPLTDVMRLRDPAPSSRLINESHRSHDMNRAIYDPAMDKGR